MVPKTFFTTLALGCFSLIGCDGSGGASRVHDPEIKARLLWENRCAACHGIAGRGDGVAVPGLRATPRDLTHPDWQRSVTDDRIRQVIVYGGPTVGLSHIMSPNPDLEGDPRTVDALVRLVRRLEPRHDGP